MFYESIKNLVSAPNCSFHTAWRVYKEASKYRTNYGVYSSFSFQYKFLWKYTNNFDKQ